MDKINSHPIGAGLCKVALISFLLSACTVGPDYRRPTVQVPPQFKEAAKGWKVAQPRDDCDRGEWWKVFNDPQLTALEQELTASNQSIAVAEANYRQSLAVVDEARAAYFPTLTGSASLTRQKSTPNSGSLFSSVSSAGAASSGAATAGGGGAITTSVTTFHSLLLNGSWEPDVWGLVRRTVEADVSAAQASAALLAATKLSSQASLAQYYFELRGVDKDQQILNDTVANDRELLKLVKNQYASGVAALADIVQAESQLQAAQALAINNGVVRAQYEHAIAILLGKPPALFSMPFTPRVTTPPPIPVEVPSVWLERRPDIAQAERLAAQANAEIGVAIAAFYPTLTLSASSSYAHKNYNNWFSIPGSGWALGSQLAELIFDGGLRNATVAAARAGYDSNVANYRQTVLTAFQDVEDNLSSLRILHQQAIVEKQAVASARLSLKLVINQYKAGTVPYSSIVTAQTTAFTAEKSAADVDSLRMTAAVGLVKALGGGWNSASLN